MEGFLCHRKISGAPKEAGTQHLHIWEGKSNVSASEYCQSDAFGCKLTEIIVKNSQTDISEFCRRQSWPHFALFQNFCVHLQSSVKKLEDI